MHPDEQHLIENEAAVSPKMDAAAKNFAQQNEDRPGLLDQRQERASHRPNGRRDHVL